MANRKHQGGYLTIFSADGTELYGELADAVWDAEESDGGENDIFSGLASEGTFEAFRKLNMDGIEHVAYKFEANGETSSGQGRLLALERAAAPASGMIRVERV
ncbi:MAG: hypothetical protein ACAH95_17380 [Fimbriimonas sp.]